MHPSFFRVVEAHRFTAPIHFAYDARFVRDVIREIVLLNILGIVVAEFRVAHLNTVLHTVLVLLPQQLERNAGLLQFAVNVFI